MRSTLRLASYVGGCVALSVGVNAHAPVAQTEQSSTGAWAVRVIIASQPQTVPVLGGAIYGRSGIPPANQRWLQLHLEMTPPQPEASIDVQSIRVVDNVSNGYSAVAMANVEDTPTFSFFEDIGKRDFSGRVSAGFGLLDKDGGVTAFVVKPDPGSKTTLSVKKKEAVKMFVLFAVPATSSRLSLQVEAQAVIPLTLVQKD